MGFMGLAVVGILLVALAVAAFMMILFFILAVILGVKGHKIAAVVFTSIGTVILAGLVTVGILVFMPKNITIQKPDGSEFKIIETEAYAFSNAITNKDIEAVQSLLGKYPDLVYYKGINGQCAADEASTTLDIGLTRIILDHGGQFDGEFEHRDSIYNYSLEYFFSTVMGVRSSKEINDMVKFMLDNGAQVNFEDKSHPNALFRAVWYIVADGSVDDTDIELLQMLIDHGASISEKSTDYYPKEFLEMVAEQYGISDGDQGYEKAKQVLTR